MRIRVTCMQCRKEADLRPQEIELHRAATAEAPVVAHYAFDCPSCRRRIVRTADERALRLLEAGGVRPSESRSHPEDPPDGPPFRLDDLIDLHLLLSRSNWFDLLAQHVELA